MMRCIGIVGAYVEASIFINPTLVRAQEFAIFRYELGEGIAFPPG